MSPRSDAPDDTQTPPRSAVPASAVTVAKIGGTVALAAAAAISAQSLISLGHLLGLHGRVAWLLPTSLDVYAATSIWVGYRIPTTHPASAVARRGAGLALALSVGCNMLYHLLLLAGHEMPGWLTDGLLVLVGALPPLVVERIFHLQMAIRDGKTEEHVDSPEAAEVASESANDNDKPSAVKTAPAASSVNQVATTTQTVKPAELSTTTVNDNPAPIGNDQSDKAPVVNPKPARRPSGDNSVSADEAHVAATLPIYRQILENTGKRPTAPALVKAVPGLGSDTRAKQIREIIERRFPELAPRLRAVESIEHVS